jgi:hypothetical protein
VLLGDADDELGFEVRFSGADLAFELALVLHELEHHLAFPAVV